MESTRAVTTMVIQATASDQLDILVEALCIQLSLTPTQHAIGSRAYQSLGDWLSDGASSIAQFCPSVYPQGSLPLGTAVKPRHGDEFDADGVCLLTRRYEALAPAAVYELVLARIREHALYRQKIEPLERCIRINYEGNFHLDIVPAVPGDAFSTRIRIPSRDRMRWQSSNPKGYESWFHSRETVQRLLGSIRADAEPMPAAPDPSHKPPLQRSAQLFKRRRDVYFDSAPDLAPKSILLTTLVADNYVGQRLVTDATVEILSRLAAQLPIGVPPRVDNPSNPGENLARHWAEDHGAYNAFLNFRADFQNRMAGLQNLRGLDRIAAALRELFDPDGAGGFVDRAVASTTASFQVARMGGQIGLAPRNSGLVSRATVAAATAIPRNSFFGDD